MDKWNLVVTKASRVETNRYTRVVIYMDDTFLVVNICFIVMQSKRVKLMDTKGSNIIFVLVGTFSGAKHMFDYYAWDGVGTDGMHG